MFELDLKDKICVLPRGGKFKCEDCSFAEVDCFDFACNSEDRKDKKNVFFAVIKEKELIGKDSGEFYCSAGKKIIEDGMCPFSGDSLEKVSEDFCGNCGSYHRKYPTLDEYRQEYGKEWQGAVYYRIKPVRDYWSACDLNFILSETRGVYKDFVEIVAACSPFGFPEVSFEVKKEKISWS
jgi:hypothetical protein